MIFIFRRFKKKELLIKRLKILGIRTGICAGLLVSALIAAQNGALHEAISRQLLYQIDFADFLTRAEALLETLFAI